MANRGRPNQHGVSGGASPLRIRLFFPAVLFFTALFFVRFVGARLDHIWLFMLTCDPFNGGAASTCARKA
jgi:hypothetical protein